MRPSPPTARFLCVIALSCGALGFAAPGIAQTATRPLVGTWSWTLFDGKCTETLHYKADGNVLATSAESVVEWSYKVTPEPSAKGFYKVVEQAVRVNGKKDCYGDVMADSGATDVRYLQFSPAGSQMIVCKSESLDACFGPLRKAP